MKFKNKKIKKNNNITIFVPIRKGSKRIKNKNIKPLPGLKFGITELKINQLNQLRLKYKKIFRKKLEIIISTDCKKIQNFLKNINWIKVIKRDKSLSTDDSLSKLIKYVPKICLNKYIFDTLLVQNLMIKITSILLNNFLNKKKFLILKVLLAQI